MKTLKKKQSGFTLIELFVVIAIISAGIALYAARGQVGSSQSEINNELQNLTQLSACPGNIFGTAPNYAGLANSVVINNECVPRIMQGSGSNIRHSWNNGTGVVFGTANSNENWTITYNTVPRGACNALVSKTIGAFLSVTVNGTSITSVANASSTCGNSNTVVWTGV